MSRKRLYGGFFIGLAIVTAVLLFRYRFGFMYGTIDSNFFELNSSKFLSYYLYWWGDARGAGELQSIAVPRVFEAFFTWFIHLFVRDAVATNWLKNLLLNLGEYTAVFFALRSSLPILAKEKEVETSVVWTVLLSLIVVLNPYFLQSVSVLLFFQRYALICFCLILIALNHFVVTKKGWGWIAVAFLFALGGWDIFPYWLPYGLFLLVYTLMLWRQKYWSFKQGVLFWVLYFAIQLPVLVSIAFYALNLSLKDSSSVKYAQEVFQYANRNSYFLNGLAWIGGVNWDQKWNWKDVLVFPFRAILAEQWWGRLLRAIPMGLWFSLWLQAKKPKFLFWFGPLAALFMFMAAANNPPLGSIYQYLFTHTPILAFYREPHTKFYPVLVILVLLALHAAIPKKKLYQGLWGGAIGVYLLLILVTIGRFSAYSAGNFFSIPDAYATTAKYVTGDTPVLVLPEYSILHSYEYQHYGISPFQDILSQPTVFLYDVLDSPYNTNFYNGILHDFSLKKGSTTYLRGDTAPTFDLAALDHTPINYIVFDGYLTGVPSYTDEERQVLKQALDQNDRFTSLGCEGRLCLYKRNTPVSWVDAPKTTVEKRSPIAYRVHFEDLRGTQVMNFFQSFNRGWKIMPDCSGTIAETFSEYLSLGFRKPLFDESHRVSFGYANQWTLNQTELLKRLPPGCYAATADGGITFDVYLYFSPQIYFYLAILISLLSAGTILFFLCRSRSAVTTLYEKT